MGGSSGGSSTQVNVDKEYNKRLAQIAEAQQSLAEEMQGYYRQYGLPVDTLTSRSQYTMMPYQAAANISQIQAQQELLPYQGALTREQIESQRELLPHEQSALTAQFKYGADRYDSLREMLPQAKGLGQDFMKKSQEGLNPDEWMGYASADVAKGFQGAEGAMTRQAGRMGINPASERFTRGLGDMAKQRATTDATARNLARRDAEQESYNRLQQGAGYSRGILGG